MGLSASQARLLTITARKSDCEFQSMRYSHEKIALSRSMTDVSTEYQNALNQTKLVYDFYGNGDVNTPLTYGLMMTPSELNGYMPILTTDASGKAVLNTQYAQAARAAGIPQEGFGCLPSTDVRNKFLQGLADSGIISQETAKTCQGIQYSQGIGLGSTDLVTTKTRNVSLDELAKMIDMTGFSINLSDSEFAKNTAHTGLTIDGGDTKDVAKWFNDGNKITMTDLLNNDYSLIATSEDEDGRYAHFEKVIKMSQLDCWEQIIEAFSSVLGDGTALSKNALDYAAQKTRDLVYFSDMQYTDAAGQVVSGNTLKTPAKDNPCIGGWGGYESHYCGYTKTRRKVKNHMVENTKDYIGYYGLDGRNGNTLNTFDGMGISISNIAKALLTYYVQYMEGYGKSAYAMDSDTGINVGGGRGHAQRYNNIDGENRTVFNNRLIGIDSDYQFTIVDSIDINADQGLISGFYDAMFNQICTRGWVENAEVDDKSYLQEMLQTGKLFLATCTDDGYYYQGNYETNTYIKEVTDDEAIAKAEAKYNTEKQKLNHKEEIIDLKMKNLDTEISSLTTEYDTVKSIISKNIEKGFKRYDA